MRTVRRIASVAVLALLVSACGGGSDQPSPSVTESPAGTTAPTEELLSVQATFCENFLPFLAVIVDVGIITWGDAISTENEDDVLFLIDVNRAILRETKTLMTIDSARFEGLGEGEVSEAVAYIATVAGDMVSASDGLALAIALNPDRIDAVIPMTIANRSSARSSGAGTSTDGSLSHGRWTHGSTCSGTGPGARMAGVTKSLTSI